ncbi:hypothetical protein DOY81_012557 [Sarcophaga bullata]|nr:hypothetical protein DOY81_012557 [Sarcophaga bullata]
MIDRKAIFNSYNDSTKNALPPNTHRTSSLNYETRKYALLILSSSKTINQSTNNDHIE